VLQRRQPRLRRRRRKSSGVRETPSGPEIETSVKAAVKLFLDGNRQIAGQAGQDCARAADIQREKTTL